MAIKKARDAAKKGGMPRQLLQQRMGGVSGWLNRCGSASAKEH